MRLDPQVARAGVVDDVGLAHLIQRDRPIKVFEAHHDREALAVVDPGSVLADQDRPRQVGFVVVVDALEEQVGNELALLVGLVQVLDCDRHRPVGQLVGDVDGSGQLQRSPVAVE